MFIVFKYYDGAAAIARKAGEPMSLEEVIVAPPESGEVRLRIICSSLCYSDVTFWKMKVRNFVFNLTLITDLLLILLCLLLLVYLSSDSL